MITPEFHHWHHSYEREAHCSNYSVFLPLWDVLFGTYYMPRNKRPVRYGVSEDVPATMRGQLLFPFRGVRPFTQMVRHPWRSVRAGFGVITAHREGRLAIVGPPTHPLPPAGRAAPLDPHAARAVSRGHRTVRTRQRSGNSSTASIRFR